VTIEEAAKALQRMCATAEKGEKVVQIHLFGIKYADQLDGMSLPDIAVGAGLGESFKTEIRKGMKLAKYVELKRRGLL